MNIARLARIATVCALLAGGGLYAAFSLSPWPRALMIRRDYDRNSVAVGAALQRRAPTGVAALHDLPYGEPAADARLDVFFPAELRPDKTLPAIVWLHGGGWLSGDKAQIAGYLKLLAARGYVVVGVNYSLAPGTTYPTPVRQTFDALAYLTREAARLHIDPHRFVLAGDSAGAQIVAQAAEISHDAAYAGRVGVRPSIARDQIGGLLLFCGAYDVGLLDLTGPGSNIRHGYLWAYSGAKDFLSDPEFATFSIRRYVTQGFPPAFVTAGDADPFLPQSKAFVTALQALNTPVDALFFEDNQPPLPHEYQFDLDLAASREALDRAVAFVNRVTRAR